MAWDHPDLNIAKWMGGDWEFEGWGGIYDSIMTETCRVRVKCCLIVNHIYSGLKICLPKLKFK